MTAPEELRKIITANHSLQIQLEELNAVLFEREQEIALLAEAKGLHAELQSRVDSQLEAFHSMQNSIGEKEKQVEGAVERELELQQELTGAALLQQNYQDLLQQYNYLVAQYTDIEDRYNALKLQQENLEQLNGRIGELKSQLANTVMEREEWKSRAEVREKPGPAGKLEPEI